MRSFFTCGRTPKESHNLAGSPAARPMLERMRGSLSGLTCRPTHSRAVQSMNESSPAAESRHAPDVSTKLSVAVDERALAFDN